MHLIGGHQLLVWMVEGELITKGDVEHIINIVEQSLNALFMDSNPAH